MQPDPTPIEDPMPTHPLGEYLPLTWEYADPEEIYVYGHVSAEDFAVSVAAYEGGTVDTLDFGFFPVLTGTVRHRWARFVFAGSDEYGNPTRTLREYPEAGRGRFAITASTPERWIRFERCGGLDGDDVCWIRSGHAGPCMSAEKLHASRGAA